MQQPKRRPAPLSDELFAATSPAGGGYRGGPVLLGSASHGVALKVKNTFLDFPSVPTPVSAKDGPKPQLTAPASLNKSCLLLRRPAPALEAQEEEEEMCPWAAVCTPEAWPSLFSSTPGSSLIATPLASRKPAQQQQQQQQQQQPLAAPPARPAARDPLVSGYASLFAGPITYAMTPNSAKAHGLRQAEEPQPRPWQAVPRALAHAGAAPGAKVAAAVRSVGEAAAVAVGSGGAAARPPSAAPPAPEPAAPTEEADLEAESGEESDSLSEDGAQAQPSLLQSVANAPKPPPGALHPSVGSETHALGMCKRCCFFSRGRCLNGYECDFCHYEHDKRKRKNKKKRTKVIGLSASYQAGRSAAFPSRRERSGIAALLGRGDLADTPAGLLAIPASRPFAGGMASAPTSMVLRGCCEAAGGQQLIVYHAAPQAMSVRCPQVAPGELLVTQQIFLPQALSMDTSQVLLQQAMPFQQHTQVAAAAQMQQAVAHAHCAQQVAAGQATSAAPAAAAPPPGQPPLLLQQVGGHSMPPPPPMQSPKLRQLFGVPAL